jgi:hypothetical protein
MRVLAEEFPPAYTPGPDIRHGEQTVDIGPVRPFIQDDTAALEESLRRRRQMGPPGILGANRQQAWGFGGSGRGGPGNMSLSGLLIELLTVGGVRSSPGRSQHRPSLLSSPRGRPVTPMQPQLTGTPILPPPTGDPHIFVQPTATPAMGTSRGRWDQYPGQRGAPRSGLHIVTPPVHPSSLQTRRSSPSIHTALSESELPVTRLPDPRPTAHVTSGRPLLHDGRVLVYPLGYECPKCTSYSFAFASIESVVTRFASTTGHNRGYRPLRGPAFQGTPSALVPGDPLNRVETAGVAMREATKGLWCTRTGRETQTAQEGQITNDPFRTRLPMPGPLLLLPPRPLYTRERPLLRVP